MPSFRAFYRSVYRRFGYPLAERSALPSKRLTAASKRLGCQSPRHYVITT